MDLGGITALAVGIMRATVLPWAAWLVLA